MNCAEFDRWLDDGMSRARDQAAREHARSCQRCGAVFAAALDLDAELGAYAAPAPAAFTERVMARVAAAPRFAPAAVVQGPALAWWVRAAADRAAVLAMVLAGVLIWRGDAIERMAMSLADGMLAAARSWMSLVSIRPGALPAALTAPFANPLVLLGLSLAALPAFLWAAGRLFAWAERSCAPGRARRRATRR